MNNRIKKVRSYFELNQEDFGSKIGITKSSVSLLESGRNSPSEQTIKLICSNFNVNEDWLRNGTGGNDNMLVPEDMLYIQKIGKFANEKNEFKKFYLSMMLDLPDEYWDYIYNEFKKFDKKNKEQL